MGFLAACLRSRPALVLPLWAWLATVSVGPLRGDGPEQLKSRFLKEAPRAWDEYRAYAERLQGSLEGTTTVQGGPYSGKPDSSSRLEFKSNPNCKLVLVQKRGPRYRSGSLDAFNGAYGFRLKRKAADVPWVLADLRVGARRYSPREWEDNGWTSLFACILAGGGESLPDLVRQQAFRVVRAGTVQRDGAELVQIDFENPHAWSPKLSSSIQAGTLLLDPARFWILRSCTLRCNSGGLKSTLKADLELSDPSAKQPIPKRWVRVHDQPEREEGRLVVTHVADYDLREVSSSPGDEEFTLSAFGLPEPMGVPRVGRSGPRWYLWFMGLAILSLAIGAFLWRRVQRRNLADAQPPSSSGAQS